MECNDEFRISLAGAQEKTALLWHQGRWLMPHGATPTTHIFKLPMGLVGNMKADLTTSVENEWLCVNLLKAFGLPVANTQILDFAGQRVLGVERFDRQLHSSGGWLLRLPQEDFCQVMGVPPHRKYEFDGGPGLQDRRAAGDARKLKVRQAGGEASATIPHQQGEAGMLQWLRGKRVPQANTGHATNLSEALAAHEMAWRPDTSVPIPDWELQPWPQAAEDEALHRLANGRAAAWLDAMIAALAGQYTRTESDNFMLLSALEPRPTRVLLDYLERSRRRVLATLPHIAADKGHGKNVVMVLGDEDSYYQYVSNYGSSSSEPEAYSGGMFIDAGYGHFVFAQSTFESMERVVVHELTHCMVRHLPIPAWLNEGLAVNVEHRFVPQRPRYQPHELRYLFGRFWNASTIQEFWSGKSFLRPDDGQPLSYELASVLVQLLDKDHDLLTRFCTAARYEDAGEEAARSVLGASLNDLAAVVLGAGEWTPEAASWAEGTEKGQF